MNYIRTLTVIRLLRRIAREAAFIETDGAFDLGEKLLAIERLATRTANDLRRQNRKSPIVNRK